MSYPLPGSVTVIRPTTISLPTSGGEQGFRLLSDLHLGAANVDERLIRSELEDARERGDRVLINGDLFDLILPKDHKRFDPAVLHPRLRGRADVVNVALDMAEELLQPYVSIIDVIGSGNHETHVEKLSSVDVISLLIGRLNRQGEGGHCISPGGYCGFVDYRFRDEHRHSARFLLFYHHGTGKGSSLSDSVSEFRNFDFVDGVDAIWLGHKHSRMSSHVSRIGCPLTGSKLVERDVRLIRTGAYMKVYFGTSPEQFRKKGRQSNYAADWGLPNHGRGGARLILRFDGDRKYSVRVEQ